MDETLKPYGTELGQCPKCLTPIKAGYMYPWCPKCSKKLPDVLKALVQAHSNLTEPISTTPVGSNGTPTVTTTNDARTRQPASHATIINRYLDLYRVARFLVGLGSTVKVFGICAGIAILLLCTIAGVAGSKQASAIFFVMFIVGAIFGTLVGGVIFLLGIVISAQGQILKANGDAAVHTSPFLTDDEKLSAMSL